MSLRAMCFLLLKDEVLNSYENSWNFTKLGHVDNMTQEELKRLLGDGDVTITLSLK